MYTLRSLTPSDLPDTLSFWQAVPEVELNESDTPERLTAYLERNPKLSPVAVVNGKIVGAALCGHDGRRGYLNHLAVADVYRQKGLGRALVDYCLMHLSALDILKCNVFVSADNNSGQLFWRKQKFQEKPWMFWQRGT